MTDKNPKQTPRSGTVSLESWLCVGPLIPPADRGVPISEVSEEVSDGEDRAEKMD